MAMATSSLSLSLAATLLLLLVAAVVASAASESEEAPVGSVFFLEKDWLPGSKMTLHFTRAAAGAPALSRDRADSIPFDSTRVPEILSRLSVPAGSPAAAAIRSTLAECEVPALAGETKLCATSLESMADFVASSLGTRDVRAVSTKLYSSSSTPPPRQAYTVRDVKPLVPSGADKVACHRMPYPYAVFRCHYTPTTAVYAVTLAGAEGTTVKAVGVSHQEAVPEPQVAEASKNLGVAPGSAPVYHFLPQDDMLWVRS